MMESLSFTSGVAVGVTCSVVFISSLYLGAKHQLLPAAVNNALTKIQRGQHTEQSSVPKQKNAENEDNNDNEEEDDEDDDFDDGGDESGNIIDDPGMGEQLKIMLCIRTDLKMKKGKMIAQACHAAVGCYQRARKYTPKTLKVFEMTGSAKIAVKLPSEEKLFEVLSKAQEAGLNYYVVQDAGRTQVAPGSLTVIGIGPAPRSRVDPITKSFKLM
eukprot:g25.t1